MGPPRAATPVRSRSREMLPGLSSPSPRWEGSRARSGSALLAHHEWFYRPSPSRHSMAPLSRPRDQSRKPTGGSEKPKTSQPLSKPCIQALGVAAKGSYLMGFPKSQPQDYLH